MTPEQWQRVCELFQSALRLPRAEQPAMLERECPDDAFVRRLAHAMLLTELPASSIAGPGPVVPEAILASPPLRGLRPLRVLGRGGMGVVYLAQQDDPEQLVAVKLLRPDKFSAENLERFEREKQALGRLTHPLIARIYGAGTVHTDAGEQPYFVMEYVDGVRLDQYAEAEQLDLTARLHMLIALCDAVQHAHQKLIAHRDLKPGNILVDRDGRLKVVDFGIARLMDLDQGPDSRVTAPGDILGTLEYTSPEQVAGSADDVDLRADVYGLGAVGYRLLGGRPPFSFKGMTLEGCLRAVRERDPVPLGRIHADLKGDIEAIISKATEKDRARRYETPHDLKADIERFLRTEPVMARPLTRRYRTGKWLRRHRIAVGVVASLGFILLLGLAGTTAGLIGEAIQRREAERAAEINDEVNRIVENMLAAATPEVALGQELTVRSVLDKAARTLDESPPEHALVEAGVRNVIGNAYINLSRYDDARTNLTRARSIREAELGAVHALTLVVLHNLGTCEHYAGDLGRAEPMLRNVVEQRRKQLGPDDADTLLSTSNLAAMLKDKGDFAEAERLFVQVLAARVRLLGESHASTVTAMNNLATVLDAQGKPAEAAELLGRVAAACRTLWGENHPRTLMAMHNQAQILASDGKLEEAIDIERKVLDAQTEVSGRDHKDTLLVMSNLGNLLRRQGTLEEALALLREAAELGERTLGSAHRDTLLTRLRLARCFRAGADVQVALDQYRAVEGGQSAALGVDHPDTLATKTELLLYLMELERFFEAETLAHEVFDARRRIDGEAKVSTWIAEFNWATALLRGGHAENALPLFEEAARGVNGLEPIPAVEDAVIRGGHGLCLHKLGRYEEAERVLVEAHRDIERLLGPGDPRARRLASSVADVYEALGNTEAAAEYRRKVKE